MALLMHLGFDNARRLKRTTYYLQYRDIRFKLIQNNPRKWSDVLLTLVPQNDKVLQEQAFVAAGEFLSALSWQNSSPIFVRNLGGFGVRDSSLLRESRCRIFSPPSAGFHDELRGIRHHAPTESRIGGTPNRSYANARGAQLKQGFLVVPFLLASVGSARWQPRQLDKQDVSQAVACPRESKRTRDSRTSRTSLR